MMAVGRQGWVCSTAKSRSWDSRDGEIWASSTGPALSFEPNEGDVVVLDGSSTPSLWFLW